MQDTIRQRLDRLGVELPEQLPPRHPYLATREDDGLLYLSGKTAMLEGRVRFSGPLGTAEDIDTGRSAARLCALQLLAAIENAVGLDRVGAIVKLTGFVASRPEFHAQAEVVNAASELLVEVLGPAGEHTRSAVGVSALPGGSAVELDAVVRLRPAPQDR